MRLIETLKKDREQLKELPDQKSKMTFVWDYYKIPIVVFLFVFFLALLIMVNDIGRRDVSMYVLLLKDRKSVV